MNINIDTITVILIISSIFQGIIIFIQSSVNREYQGINVFGIGCFLFALGFLVIMHQKFSSLTLVTVIWGNSLLLLALIFQYAGLVRFLNMKERKWIALSIFTLFLVLMTYFTLINNEITYRIFTIHLFVGLIFLLIGFDLLKNKIISLMPSIRFLAGLFLSIGTFTILRAFFAFGVASPDNALSSTFLQLLSFTGVFILNFIITFTFVFMINKRLSTEIKESKEHFEKIFDLSPDASLITALPDGNIIEFNQRFLQFTGFTRAEVANKNLIDLNIYEDMNDRQKLIKTVTENKSVKNLELNLRYKDKSIHVCSVSAAIIKLNDVPHMMSIIHDITDRKNAEIALKTSEEKYRLLTEFASDVIWVFNISENKFAYMSPSILELRGLSPEEAMMENIGNSMTRESLSLVRTAINNNVKTFVANPEDSNNYLYEIQQICKNGDVIWVEVSTKYRYDSSGAVEIVGVSRNIEKRKQAEEEVLYLSYHDQLTGLYNRRFYEEELERLNTKRNLPIALIMADINGLKLINDAYGHQVGDNILKKVAVILKGECRSDELIFRTGGDEFVILLPKSDLGSPEKIIERLYATISKVKIEHTILSVSMGFAVKENISEDITDVFKKAEDAMYSHKLTASPSVKKATIDLIVESIYEKNNQEMAHTKTVSDFCEAIIKEMGFEAEAVSQIGMVGLRHDIGEIAIDEAILNKTEALTADEWIEVKRHPEIGYHILRSVNELAEVAKYVLEHHERWDGNGYPKGLKGEEISLQGRIVAIADAYSAMTSERPFRKALTHEEAVAEIKKCSGTQFDADIARIFTERILAKNDKSAAVDGQNIR